MIRPPNHPAFYVFTFLMFSLVAFAPMTRNRLSFLFLEAADARKVVVNKLLFMDPVGCDVRPWAEDTDPWGSPRPSLASSSCSVVGIHDWH